MSKNSANRRTSRAEYTRTRPHRPRLSKASGVRKRLSESADPFQRRFLRGKLSSFPLRDLAPVILDVTDLFHHANPKCLFGVEKLDADGILAAFVLAPGHACCRRFERGFQIREAQRDDGLRLDGCIRREGETAKADVLDASPYVAIVGSTLNLDRYVRRTALSPPNQPTLVHFTKAGQSVQLNPNMSATNRF